MTTEAPKEAEATQEPAFTHPRPTFNTMQEKLEKLMTPFVQHKPATENGTEAVAEQPKPIAQPVPADPAQSKPATPPTEPKTPDEEIPESIRRSPKASEEFKKISNTAKQFKAEVEKHAAKVKALEEENQKLKSTPPPVAVMPPEFETIKKQNEELSDQLKAAAIERHPNFRSYYESRTKTAIEKAKDVIGQEITDKAVKIAQLPPSDYRTEQLDKMITEIQESSPSKALFLSDLVRDINAINYDRESALKKAREDYDMVQRKEREAEESTKAELAKRKESMISAALELAKGLDSFKRGDDAKLNEAVDTREGFVKAFFNAQVDQNFLPSVPVLAMEADYLKQTVIPALREENAKLAKQVQEMTASNPRPAEGGDKGNATPQYQPGQSFIARFKANAPPLR